MLEFDLSTVLKGKSAENLKGMANDLADAGISSYADAMNTAYTLLSAGISENEAKVGTEIASKVALLTKGHAADIANVMATAAKDFNLSMQEVGDTLAKAQNIFQIQDFHQLEEGLKYVAASASSLNIPLAQTAALIGTLNDAGKVGGMAGTGVASIFNSMGKVAQDLKMTIPKSQDGGVNVVGFVGEIGKKLQTAFGDDDIKKLTALNKMFGEQGANAFLILQKRFDELKEKEEELAHSKGFVEDQSKVLKQLFSIRADGLVRSLSHLSGVLGDVLLPALTYIVGILGDAVS
jgi:TP901 family phage tail tape measure protein